MKRIILFVTGLGIIFFASAVQTYGTNRLGQGCRYPGPCFHPEWLAMGIGLSAVAYIVWKMRETPPKRIRRSFFSIFDRRFQREIGGAGDLPAGCRPPDALMERRRLLQNDASQRGSF
jgi:hypothetical protein